MMVLPVGLVLDMRPNTIGKSFDGDRFKSMIREVRTMATPNKQPERVIFHWEKNRQFNIQTDRSGVPYSKNVKPVADNTPEPVEVLCSVTYVDRAPSIESVGNFDTPRAVLEMFSEEFDQIRGASYVYLGGSKYNIDYATVEALFDVDSYTLHCTAESEG